MKFSYYYIPNRRSPRCHINILNVLSSHILNYKHITEMIESNIQYRNIGWGFSPVLFLSIWQRHRWHEKEA